MQRTSFDKSMAFSVQTSLLNLQVFSKNPTNSLFPGAKGDDLEGVSMILLQGLTC